MSDPQWTMRRAGRRGWWLVADGHFPPVLIGTEMRGERVVIGAVATGTETGSLDAATLRKVPLRAIEARLNNTGDARSWVEASDAAAARLSALPVGGETPLASSHWSKPMSRPKLARPARPTPPEFWSLVAAVYREQAQRTNAPAVAMAEEAGVPVRTAQGWIAQARKKNVLDPGEQGRAV